MRKLDAIAQSVIGYHSRKQKSPKVQLLLHFDGDYTDASRYNVPPIFSGCAYSGGMSNPWSPCPVFGGALRLANVRYECGVTLTDFSIELFIGKIFTNRGSCCAVGPITIYGIGAGFGGGIYYQATRILAWPYEHSVAHIAVVRRGDVVRIYQSGSLIGTAEGLADPIQADWRVGSSMSLPYTVYVGCSEPLADLYDEVRILSVPYDRQNANGDWVYPVPLQPYTGYEDLNA